ncbi:segregation and condensation protein A [Streptomyces sp. AF1A]|uniref:segregation and condensation protein A n=1 Tax=Streptomyces sp. AF1A TaxID=3394350 RepID=UPI0039BC9623
MTSNDVPPSGAGAARRRALGRGPGVPRVPPRTEPAPEAEIPAEAGAPSGAEVAAEAAAPAEAEVPAEEAEAPAAVEVVAQVEAQPGAEIRAEAAVPAEAEAPAAVEATAEAEAPVEGGAPIEVEVTAEAEAPAEGEAPIEAGALGAVVPDGFAVSEPEESRDGVFKVRLSNFEGPFDLLLQLISKHKLDVTEVALSKVTDEFMAHIRAMGPDWDLDQTTEFLVVAATLLDLKAARLLPAAEVEDEADLALLEARDLLFARLLQYRAYKQIADIFNARMDEEARRHPRTVGLEPEHAELLPEVVISIGPEGFARLAVKAMQPKPKPQVYVDHIHAPLVSVQEQAGIVVARLKELGEASFRALVEDTDDTLTVVARFLALLELYREKAVALEQEAALGELIVRWTGGEGDAAPVVTDEFDRPPEAPKEEEKP